MSINFSCDQFENSSFSIRLSPRRDVAKKRLRSLIVVSKMQNNTAETKYQADNNLSLKEYVIINEKLNDPSTISNIYKTAKTLENFEEILEKSDMIKSAYLPSSSLSSSTSCYSSLSEHQLSKMHSIATDKIRTSSKAKSCFANTRLNDQNQHSNYSFNKNCDHKMLNESKHIDIKNEFTNPNNNVDKYIVKENDHDQDSYNNFDYDNDLTNFKEKCKQFFKFFSLNNRIVKLYLYHIVFLIFLNQINIVKPTNALLIVNPTIFNYGNYDSEDQPRLFSELVSNLNPSHLQGSNITNHSGTYIRGSNDQDQVHTNDQITIRSGGGHYLDKLDNLERSVAAVLMKVAYGTTSTTKRSIPDNTFIPSLTTIATPPLTTLRYSEKSPNQQQLNLHHRNYELDLERDHVLPTSAPNADILKSNSNPSYPNPNRHHNHDRDRHRHLANSTPAPSIHNLLNKGQPTIAMFPGDMPSYSPPARAFFTPPLPPEYQNPFADKPTLRGTNNDGTVITPGNNNQQNYINRRPIPPPSLMPGHERIPFRPPEFNNGQTASSSLSSKNSNSNIKQPVSQVFTDNSREINANGSYGGFPHSSKAKNDSQHQRKKALNTPSQKVNSKIDPTNDVNNLNSGSRIIKINNVVELGTGKNVNINGDRVPNISRILSGSNGKKEEIPEILLKQVTNRPISGNGKNQNNVQFNKAANISENINQSKENRDELENNPTSLVGIISTLDESSEENDDEDFEDIFSHVGGTVVRNKKINDMDEPKTQLTIKINGKSTENPFLVSSSSNLGSHQNMYSTKNIHSLSNDKNLVHLTTSIPSGDNSHYQAAAAAKETKKSNSTPSTTQNNSAATWDIAWNIHVYLSVVLFTMLGVYSIFKMIFYNKLSHLFSQSYFLGIHLILITTCVARIFYLIYDAYNINSSLPIFVSEILLNLPAIFLVIAFSILTLFLLIRSLNHKTNRYSALIRPLTVLVGSLVHVVLCVTLHLVESYTTAQNSHLHFFYQQQQNQQNRYNLNSGNGGVRSFVTHHNGIPIIIPPPPPRVLSLICQIIYIFVCLSLGLLYLYIYRILKRVLRSKSQNYIHGYQNLSYAIHITIATALLFVLLAALQIFGAISISTTRSINMTTVGSEVDWLQWGYQFSLRLIEIAIIWLMSWVAGLKTGGTPGVLHREKNVVGTSSGGSHENHHNISGFALFPCTSSSSQEHFETDYPAVCNANTNLHTYTLRTGKPIYDDSFALNSLQNSNTVDLNNAIQLGPNNSVARSNDFKQQQTNHSDFVRSYETSSLRSGRQGINKIDSDILNGVKNESTTDHYENPNFELRGTKMNYSIDGISNVDNCYSEPLNPLGNNSGVLSNRKIPYEPNYDFQNLERPNFNSERTQSRANDYNTMIIGNGGTTSMNHKSKINSKFDRSSYENPERRSSNSTHSCANTRGIGHYTSNDNSVRGYSQYNSFDRRNSGVRKSGTLNSIGTGINTANPNHIHGRNGSSSSSTSTHSNHNHRTSGAQTLSSALRSGINGSVRMNTKGNSNFYRGSNSRTSLEQINSVNTTGGVMVNSAAGATNHNLKQLKQYDLQADDEILLIANNSQTKRTNLINGHNSGNSSGNDVNGGITSSTSGGNLTDMTTNGLIENNDGMQIKQQNFLNSINSIGGSAIVNNGNNYTSGGGSSSVSGESAHSGSMLVAEHGFVRFRALDDINNAQGVGIHNASIRITGRSKEKRYTNNT